MPPNADTSILRNRIATKINAGDPVNSDTATQSSLRSLKALKGTEVVIDGVIYDIADFVHPGGEVIKFFGGNDVTVQYKMIHPYHTGKHLEKMMMVGKVVDYEPE
jgi:fatty acid desaturase (delta-4 desaturase)